MLYEEVEDFERSTRIGNTALYGLPELAASTPAQFINATHAPGIVETSGGRISGMPGPLKAPIVVVATDYYGNPTDLGLMGISEITLEGCEPLRDGWGTADRRCDEHGRRRNTTCSLTGDVVSLPGEVTYPSKSFDFVQITLVQHFPRYHGEGHFRHARGRNSRSDGETKLKTTTHDSIRARTRSSAPERRLSWRGSDDKLINDGTVKALAILIVRT